MANSIRSIKYLIKTLYSILFLFLQEYIFFSLWRHYEVNTYFNNMDKLWAIIGFYTIVLCVLSKVFDVYNIGHKRLIDIFFGHFVIISLTNTLAYLQLCMIEKLPRFYSIKVLILITIVNFFMMVVSSILLKKIYCLLTPVKNAILITTYDDTLIKDLTTSKMDKRFVIEKIIKLDPRKCVIEDIKDELANYDIIIVDDIPPFMRNNILKYCYEFDKKCYATPKTSDILIRSAKINNLCHSSMLTYKDSVMTFWEIVFKRLFDIVASIIGLVVLSPLFLIIAIIIKLTDNGPIFFTQERYTKNKKIFKIYKFRSMYVHKDTGNQMASKNDKRVTPIGKIIRRLHIDELPQLINVLKGEMSIVGPRPDMVELFNLYEKTYPEYRYRLKVKAGLTGYAQVYGKYNTNPHDKLKFDLIYICNFSIWMDIRLIFMTIRVLFLKDSTEGVDDNKLNALKE